MTTELKRVGNFTSSEIYKLMSNGKKPGSIGVPGLTYIEEKKMERRLGRSLDSEVTAKPTSWGKLLEKRAFELLGIEYQLSSTETIRHKTIDCWAGSPDGYRNFETGRSVIDIKSPYTLKSFCILYDAIETCELEKLRDTEYGDRYYWQIVSNAIMSECNQGELTLYCPYQEELQDIRDMAAGMDSSQLSKYYWLVNSFDEDLPYLINGGHYKNLTNFRFIIPQEDKEALTERVLQAEKLLLS